ncbi:nuclear distribution protein nudE homolog isoform X2 [Sitodiplosis mosellana]|uniref:nuclear distribution protein nudE homolog isoform X2 n=1 Tax=Sitodiplosis mosellana TaxID=263140 RepID=UPI0024447466|nr:nuclear distribution protein nudE homolog isoform X2 [Sitodiplosis mosellana]XP_055301369.1 nuclear distribution protein nudE homolog isoform X2 [Sitodiplosis mosellana]
MDDSFKEPPVPSFESIDEECAYWKERYNVTRQKLIDVKQEYGEFEENSQQLEAELETCLEQREKNIQDLKHSLDQLQTDNESLRKKISNFEVDYNSLENRHTQLNKEFEQLRKHTREVEQKNDDLERANRVVAATVSDLETMLNQAYEKNEFLELEVEDKESLTVKHQRVLDELRDLKQEMKVKTPANSTNPTEKPPIHSDNILNGNSPPIASQKAFNIIADSLRRIDLSKLLCPTCDKLKFRCVCPKQMTPPPPSPIKPPPLPSQSATSSTHSLQTNFVRSSSKSTDLLDTDYGSNNHSIDEGSQRPTSRLFQSFQWPNVFNGRNSKSTSHLNLVNCDKMHTVSVPNQANSYDAPSPHDQLSKDNGRQVESLSRDNATTTSTAPTAP